jgi:hypothetical protein
MIFKQIAEILDRKKTQTRRVRKSIEVRDHEWHLPISTVGTEFMKADGCHVRTKWRVGNTYAIVPKRGAAGIGRYIRVTGIRVQNLHNITEADAKAEGVNSVEEYRALWDSINGKYKGCRWDDNPQVWVLEFELVELDVA